MKRFLCSVLAVISFMFVCFNLALGAAKIPKGGDQIMPVERYGSVSSATTGAAALVFTVPGLKAGATCVASTVSFGTGPARQYGPVVATADTLTVTYDANQTAGSTVVAYVCFKS